MSNDQYQCSFCGKFFKKGQSDKEAERERKIIFPEADLSQCGLVCDSCYNQIASYHVQWN